MTAGTPATRVTVSAIVPVYNNARTLRLCVEALLAQTHPPAEIIVVDDASTDGTGEIARDLRCTVLTLYPNLGPAAARNAAIRKATGDVLFFCDADGAADPDAVAEAVARLQTDPALGCVHGFYRTTPLIDDGPVEAYRLLHQYHWRTRAAGRVPSAYFTLAAYRREVFERVGLLDERLRGSEDDEFSDRMHGLFAIELTPAVRGRHDDEARLGALLRKQFRRSQWIAPVSRVERGPGGLRANRPSGILAAGAAVVSAPLPLVWAPLAVLPIGALAVYVLCDPELLRFVRRERGLAFLTYFMTVHFLVQLMILAGGVTGAVRQVLDPRFPPPTPKPLEAVEP